jgi:hypothetical protein
MDQKDKVKRGSINTSILFIIKSFRKAKDNNGIWVWITRKRKAATLPAYIRDTQTPRPWVVVMKRSIRIILAA